MELLKYMRLVLAGILFTILLIGCNNTNKETNKQESSKNEIHTLEQTKSVKQKEKSKLQKQIDSLKAEMKTKQDSIKRYQQK